MDSGILKLEAMAWLRYVKQFAYVATECGGADVLACSNDTCIEIETKISISDLKNDFKYKTKHKTRNTDFETRGATFDGVSLFYFMIPLALHTKSLEILQELEATLPVVKRYGILTVPDDYQPNQASGRYVMVARRPTRLHKNPTKAGLKDIVAARMASELIGMHLLNNRLAANVRDAVHTLKYHLEQKFEVSVIEETQEEQAT